MGRNEVAMIREMGAETGRLAGEAVRSKVMEGSERITGGSSGRETAEWVRGAMERLDALANEETRSKIMGNRGLACAYVNRREIERAIGRRREFETIDEFLQAEVDAQRISRQGDIIYQSYGNRCVCSLVKGLPAGETMSPTYCGCSLGFVKKYWEDVLESPVRVELVSSVISGGPECKFAIHL